MNPPAEASALKDKQGSRLERDTLWSRHSECHTSFSISLAFCSILKKGWMEHKQYHNCPKKRTYKSCAPGSPITPCPAIVPGHETRTLQPAASRAWC